MTSSWRTFCEFASGLSILLTATTIGTSAAPAWLMDSIGLRHHAVVGGHDEHGDVRHLAPRARRAVNASWPGVSRKVMRRPSWSTW